MREVYVVTYEWIKKNWDLNEVRQAPTDLRLVCFKGQETRQSGCPEKGGNTMKKCDEPIKRFTLTGQITKLIDTGGEGVVAGDFKPSRQGGELPIVF